jgi:hypothetical protein
MHRQKLRLRLEVGRPVFFKDTKHDKHDTKWSIELVDFLLTQTRAEWVVKLGNGELLEGRLNIARPLPFWDDSSLLLSYPVTASCKPKGTFRPEFLIRLPSHILPDHLSGR